jgi:ABC-type lipoprotein release transport system permease subunit
MYKLFLCLRYLWKRVIAYFAVVGVALCVAMMLIVTSVMSGFVDKIETAARGLFGDIVMEPHGQYGIAYHDEWAEYLVEHVPAIEATSPRIYSYGMLRIPGQKEYRLAVQITGIRFPDICDVTAFEEGLFVQQGLANPSFDPSRELMIDQVAAEIQRIRGYEKDAKSDADGKPTNSYERYLMGRFFNAWRLMADGISNLEDGEANAQAARLLLEALNEYDAAGGDITALTPTAQRLNDAIIASSTRQQILITVHHAILEAMTSQDADLLRARRDAFADNAEAFALFNDALAELNVAGGDFDALEITLGQINDMSASITDERDMLYIVHDALARAIASGNIDIVEAALQSYEDKTIDAYPHRVILGLGIEGLAWRTQRGQTVRVLGPGSKVILYVFPIGGDALMTDMSPNIQRLTIVDDCATDVSSIDSKTVYIPFEELQRLNNMGPRYRADGTLQSPGRCSLIQIKVRGDGTDEVALREICKEIRAAWIEFKKEYPGASPVDVEIQTWRERQMDLIRNIEAQRMLMVIMFSIISLVSVVLVFVIFYMIVVQKTWDIGVLKAVGASSHGVAGIFLAYGAAIGLVGSILGSIGGYYFVKYINPIQDWLDATFGFRVWSREQYMFEKIPNDIDPVAAAWIIGGAIAAGILGAIIPAIRAARMQPVEALRYE